MPVYYCPLHVPRCISALEVAPSSCPVGAISTASRGRMWKLSRQKCQDWRHELGVITVPFLPQAQLRDQQILSLGSKQLEKGPS